MHRAVPSLSKHFMNKNKKKAIIIIEDEETVRDLIVRIMQTQNYTSYTSSCGEEAINTLNNNSIDLAIIDYGLPNEDGLALAKKIEKINPVLPIILMSGLNLDLSNILIHQTNIFGFLYKPFKIETIIAKVKQGLEASICA